MMYLLGYKFRFVSLSHISDMPVLIDENVLWSSAGPALLLGEHLEGIGVVAY
jgi:hypothetical protein